VTSAAPTGVLPGEPHAEVEIRNLLPPPAPRAALTLMVAASVAWMPSCPELPPEPAGALEVWRQTAGSPERLADGDGAAEGDVVQLVYRLQGHGEGAILSVDGRGVVTEHLAPGPLSPGRVALDHAFELDDAPGFERFYLVVGPAWALEDAGEALAAGRAPEVALVAQIELRKPPDSRKR
jgi:hypothetical protein